jgi:hypothetical protein
MDGPIDYLSGIGVLPDALGAINKQIATQLGFDQQRAETAQAQAQAAGLVQKLSRAQAFQQDLASVGTNPSAQNVSALVMKYPEFADQIKSGWDLKTEAAKTADLTQLGEVYSAAASGDWDLAAKNAQARLDADKAAGISEPGVEALVGQIQSAANGDKTAQKAVLTSLGTHIAAISGPEHFATVYGALKGGYTLDANQTRFDDNGNIVAQSPFLQGADGTVYERDSTNPAAEPTSAPAQPATVASTPGGDQGFEKAVAFTLKNEGGYAAHDMNGAPVNFGINQGANPDLDVKRLTPEQAKDIYYERYWKPSGAANLPAPLQTPYFDTYVINPSRAQQFLKASGGDPQKFLQLREAWMNSVAAKNPDYAKAYASRNADLRVTMQGDSGNPAPSGTAVVSADGAPPGYHLLMGGKTSPGDYRVLSDAEVKQRGLDPAQQYQLNTKTGQVTGLGQKTSGDDVLARYGIAPGETGPSVLAKLPANVANQVKALTEGRLGPISSFALARPYWQNMLQLATQYDPTFDMNNAAARKAAIQAFTGMGKGAQVVGSVNRVANHLQTLWDESQKLAGPETGFGPLNTALAATGQAFEPADAKAYDTAVGFVAGELEKIARNSPGTEAGVDRVVQSLGRKNSLATRNSAIKTAVDIIAGAIDPLKDQYNSAFTNESTRPRIPWVTPQAQRIYSTIGGTHGGVDLSLTGAGADTNAPASAKAPVRVNSPAEAAKLPPGTLFITPDGRTMRKK